MNRHVFARGALAALAAWSTAPPPAAAFDHTHAAWTQVLAARVHGGSVDYSELKKDPAPLDAYLRSLEAVTREEYETFTRDQRLAFWIDAYNAYTVKLVVDHWPVASIKKIGHIWESPFKLDFIPLARLRGGRISLETIEHAILRQELADPRIHAAIVCASRSCPLLRSTAYTGADVDRQLDAAMRGFLADPSRNRWDAKRRTLSLSSIFKWFRDDFEKASGSLPKFVAGYLEPPVARDVLAPPEPEIDFLAYDWSVNGK